MTANESGIGGALLDAVETERQAIWKRSAALISELEASRDSDLARLDRVMIVFGKGGAAGPTAANGSAVAPRPERSRRRRRSRRVASSMAVLARREAVLRYLTEQDEPVAVGSIRRALDISASAAKSALKQLSEENKVARAGTGNGTRYYVKDDAGVGSGPPRTTSRNGQGTIGGRLLTVIRDRGSASPNELAQAVHESLDVVYRECGALVREEEIHMGRRDGKPVYIGLGQAGV